MPVCCVCVLCLCVVSVCCVCVLLGLRADRRAFGGPFGVSKLGRQALVAEDPKKKGDDEERNIIMMRGGGNLVGLGLIVLGLDVGHLLAYCPAPCRRTRGPYSSYDPEFIKQLLKAISSRPVDLDYVVFAGKEPKRVAGLPGALEIVLAHTD